MNAAIRETPVRSRILGTGSYAPERVLTNSDLEAIVDTTDDWITERTGIRQRHIAADGEASSDMAAAAAARALEAANMEASELDMLIIGTISPDRPLPSCAAYVQKTLGCVGVPAFDVAAACAGFVFALSIGDQFVRTGQNKRVLVVGVELLSRVLNWKDRTTCVLFGDGAGAAVIGPSDDERGVLSTRLYTDSTYSESLMIPAGGSREPVTEAVLENGRNKVHMVGSDIFKVAVRSLTGACRQALEDADLSADEIAWVVPHQANMRIITQVSARLRVPLDRFILNIERYGNTSSASIPIALDEGIRDGRIKPGDLVLMCGLGAGISWASALVRM